MAFEQRFQRTQNEDRKVVNTLEDQNKYDISSSRRLRVQANPINMQVEADTSGAKRLLEALGQVRPVLLEAAADNLSDQYAGDIEQGKLDALQGLPKEEKLSKWREYGYNYQKSYLQGEDLGAKLEEAIAVKDPEADFNTWYKDWWDTNAQGLPQDPETLGIFNKAFTGSLVKAQAIDAKKKQNLDTERQYTVATEGAYRSIKQIRGKGLPITMSDWNALKSETSTLYKFGHQVEDELLYGAIERYAKENTDPDALNVLYERRGDVPPLVDNPKYTDKIMSLRGTLVAKKVSDIKSNEAENLKQVKSITEDYEQSVTFKMIELSNIEDPVKKSLALASLYTEVKDNSSKLNYSTGFMSKLESRINKTDKTEASTYQEQRYRDLYNSDAPQGKLDEAVTQGDITQAQWDKLVSKKAADKQRAATLANKGEKPIQQDADYKDAVKMIYKSAGYNPNNLITDSREAGVNASKGTERFKELIEEKLDAGVPKKQAIKDSLSQISIFMENTGLTSKEAIKTNKVLDTKDKDGQVKIDPVGYYYRNPEDFIKDSKALPPNISPENKALLQKNYLKHLATKKKQVTPKPTNTDKEVN